LRWRLINDERDILLKNDTTMSFSSPLITYSYIQSRFIKLFFLMVMVFSCAADSRAQTWSPGTSDWNTAGNWSPSVVPNAQSALAAFGTFGTTSVTLSSGVSVSAIQFNSGASAFVINTESNELAFFGSGIVNNSSAAQNLVIGSGGEADFYNTSTSGNANLTNNHVLDFNNGTTAGTAVVQNEITGTVNFSNATAGNATIFNLSGGSYGLINFNTGSTAGSCTINNTGFVLFNSNSNAGSSTITNDYSLQFLGTSTAGNSNIVNNGNLSFSNSSSAEAATITNSAAGNFSFFNNSTAGNSAITNASGGGVTFYDDSTAGNSTITNSGILSFGGQGNGVSFSTAGGATITNNNTVLFNDYSTAGNSTMTNAAGEGITFNDESTAGSSNVTNNGNLVFSGRGNGVSFSTSGSATITNNNSLSFTDYSTAGNAQITNNSLSFINFLSNSNAGTASITNNSAGNIRFFGNSSAQNASMSNAIGGALDFSDDATAGNSAITNNGNLGFTGQGNGVSFSTAGSAVITNDSVMTFNDYATAGNSTITNASTGTFDFNGDSTAGSSQITNNGSLSFNGLGNGVNFSTAANSAITNNGTIYLNDYCTGANASIANNSAGILSLTQNSTLGRAALTNAGAVTFNDDTTAGNSNITNGGNLVFTGQGNGVSFSTAGGATITNNNVMVFNDYSAAGNATITNNNQLSFNNFSTAGNSAITNNGDFVFYDNSTAGNTNIKNNNLLYFELSATAGNANIVNNDNLSFFQTSTAGNGIITTGNGGVVYFWNASSGGTAQFILNSGSLDISNETAGTPITVGSIEGSGSVSLGGNQLITGSNNLNTDYSGIVADGGTNGGVDGSLAKIGRGTFTLSGTNSYTGGTDIEAGTLVAANSRALGTGSVLVNGGTLSLNGPGTLNIGGNYTQSSAGTLQLGLGGTASGQWDNLIVAGTSTLAGTLNLVSYNGFHIGENETFELLDSTSGLTGKFGAIVDSVDEPVSIVYTSNEVILDTLSFSRFALTTNEKNVADSLDNLAANAEDTALLNALTSLPTASLPSIYDELSPSNLTPLYKIRFMDSQAQGRLVWQRLSEIWGNQNFDPDVMAWDGNPMFAGNMPAEQEVQIAKSLQPDSWGGFLSGMSNFGAVVSDGNGAGYQFSGFGTTAGADYRLAKDLAGGLLIGYDQSGSSQSTGTVNVTGTQVGLYAGWKSDQFHVDAFLDGGIDSYSTQRTAFGGTANGSPSGLEYSGQLNLGYDLWVSDYDVNLFLSGLLTQVNVSGFSETGSAAPLTFTSQSEAYLDSDLGFRLSHGWPMGKMKLSPSLTAAWEHVYQGSLDSLTANFGSGNNFTVLGSNTGTDAALLGVGVNAEFAGGFSVYVDYQGKLGMTNFSEQSLSGGINVAFGGSNSKEIHATVKPAAAPILLPPMPKPTISPLPSPVATPVVILSPVPTPVTPVPMPVVTPLVIPVESPFSLGPLVPTQGIISILTPTPTPLPPGSMISPIKAKGM
jgi:autotransporter-associated beta strand protein